jgi:hypothetical protein
VPHCGGFAHPAYDVRAVHVVAAASTAADPAAVRERDALEPAYRRVRAAAADFGAPERDAVVGDARCAGGTRPPTRGRADVTLAGIAARASPGR